MADQEETKQQAAEAGKAEEAKESQEQEKASDSAEAAEVAEGGEGAESAEGAEAGAKKKLPLILIIVVVVVLIAVGAGGYFMFAGDSSSEAKEAAKETVVEKKAEEPVKLKKAHYLTIEPSLMVRLNDRHETHYVRVDVVIMARDKDFMKQLKEHEPLIRNHLNDLIASKRYGEVKDIDGKTKLRKKVLGVVQKIAEEQVGSNSIEAVYFTNYLVE